MKTYIALLRGINVSGQKRIKMADLKLVFESLDFKNVQTYIQSGNVVFEMDDMPTDHLELALEYRLKKVFAFDIPVIVLTVSDLQTVVDESPYIKQNLIDVNRLFVCFLKHEPEYENIERLSKVELNKEYYHIMNRAVYIHVPNGIGRAKLNNNFLEQKLKQSATTRNWKTLHKLLVMSNIN